MTKYLTNIHYHADSSEDDADKVKSFFTFSLILCVIMIKSSDNNCLSGQMSNWEQIKQPQQITQYLWTLGASWFFVLKYALLHWAVNWGEKKPPTLEAIFHFSTSICFYTFCKKNWAKSANSAHSRVQNNLQTAIQGCHCQLDDQCPSIKEKQGRRKNCCSFGFCPNYLPTPSLPPIRKTCTTFSGV